MNTVQAGRLLTLAYFLKTEVPCRNFRMRSYWRSPEDDICIPNLRQVDCGTTACALGWSSVVWPRTFQLVPNGYVSMRGDERDIEYDGEEVQEFFGVNEYEAEWLFGPDENRTPKQEAIVIETIVAQHGYEYAD